MPNSSENLIIPFIVGESNDPFLTFSGELLYQRALPVFDQDENYGFIGKFLCNAIMAMLQELDQIVLDSPTHPGWCSLLDPKVCPPAWLPWCAQLYGVTLTPGATIGRQREEIGELPPQNRGTRNSLIAAVQSTLTGNKNIFFNERAEGKAYRLTVVTPTAETPSEAATLRALKEQLPAGINLFYEAVSTPIWEEATKKWSEVGLTLEWSEVKEGNI